MDADDLNALSRKVFSDFHKPPKVMFGRVKHGYAGRADLKAWRIVLKPENEWGEVHDFHPEHTFMHEAAHLLTGCSGHTLSFFVVLRALCLAYLDEEAAEATNIDEWMNAYEHMGEC